MDHPFEIGKEYRNRHGRYQVLAIEEATMRVRYEEDGREEDLSISTQSLLWGSMWKEMPRQEPPAAAKAARPKGKKSTKRKAPAASKQEKLIAEILQDDKAIYEILTRLVIPPGQLDLYRHFAKHPENYLSQQQIADAVRGSDLKSERGVFMAFGRRIAESPDERVHGLKPFNSLFFERQKSGGETRLRLRPRVIEIFQSYPAFYDYLLSDGRSWRPDDFGSTHWENTPDVYRKQMAYFGFTHLDQDTAETAAGA